jgi:hypothetical protein
LTEQEEGELKRICALALAQIPHSDDVADDPLQYIAPIIQSKPPPTARPTTLPIFLPQVPAIPVGAETATPSDSSKRDTMDPTDYSTPLTSAGITPGETGKRFSDAGRRASSSKASSNLKYETAQRNKSRAISTSHSMPRKSNDTGMRKPSGDYKPAERTLRTVLDTIRLSETQSPSVENVRPARYSQLELNKQLPPLPRSATESSAQKSIARMMKTIKKKRSQIIEGRSASVSVASTPPLPSTKPELPSQRHKSMPTAPRPIVISPTETKRKFKLPFFSNRKERPQQSITVS